MTETLYEGPASNATFYLPTAAAVRFGFSDPSASGYVRSRGGSMTRVQIGTRLFLSAGEHVLILYDTKLCGARRDLSSGMTALGCLILLFATDAW
jgi:hypothetical protein